MLTASGLGAVLLVFALMMRRGKKAPKFRGYIFAGAGLLIGGGLLLSVMVWITHAAETVTGRTTSIAVGTAVPLCIIVGAGVFLYTEFEPKNSSPHKWADWVALLFPALLLSMGGAWAAATTHAHGQFAIAAAHFLTTTTQMIQGL